VNSIETTARWLKFKIGLTDGSPVATVIRPCYDLLLTILFRKNGLERNINGREIVRIRPAFRNLRDSYEPSVFAYLKQRTKPGDLVLEVGAYVGVFTTLLARWVGPGGRVYAFEPTPETARALRDHLALNNVADRVMVSPLAISDTIGQALLHRYGTSGTNRLSASAGDTVEVPLTTIDEFCAEHGIAPSLVKIDIEGLEFHALRGAMKTLRRYRPAVVVEMHPMNWAEVGASSGDLLDFIGDVGYRVVPLEGQSDPLFEYGHLALEPM
jgi:FkbM family methyltransferase